MSPVEGAAGVSVAGPDLDDALDPHRKLMLRAPVDPRLEVLHAPGLEGAPKALVVTAGYDPLKDEGAAYARALQAAGVQAEHRDYAGMIHGFYGMGGVSPGALAALDETAEALAAGLA